MKKTILLSFFLALSCSLGCQVFGVNVAISTFDVSGKGVTADHADLLIDLYTTVLSRTQGITLVERRNLDKILREQELALSDVVDSNTALRAGEIMGAAFIVTGSIISLGSSSLVSVKVIDNSTGAVVAAFDRELGAVSISGLKSFVDESAAEIGARLVSGDTGEIATLWVTKSETDRARPILIYIMSTIADSADPNGQWYYGPQHLKPVTDILRRNGYSLEIHDRRSLGHLSDARLGDYSQVWLLEGDGNATVDPTPKDVAVLYNYYLNGGGVWLSGENILNPADTNWVEDINAFAAAFGVRIERVVISREPWLSVPAGTHPLLGGVSRLVFDNEVGSLVVTEKSIRPLLFIDTGSRFLRDGLDVDQLFAWADPDRVAQVQRGKRDWSFGWLLNKNYEKVGPLVGEGVIGVAVGDERSAKGGRLIVDCGWLLGWAFNGERESIASIGEDLRFVANVASWLQ